jgi:uncharacterized hydrophobic protein (TIGR00271 family)
MEERHVKNREYGRRGNLGAVFMHFIRERFNLETDKADELETIEYMKKSVEFKGPNLWILIFAIFIASIGLNVNSTAVIIGAMLISPLMSPILGIGMSVAINDLDFLKKSFKNLMVATLFSVAASTIYFAISPLSDAQSELLARTNPTIWDVLIALFGGLAGIVAGSRKEKSNAIPGVAIATALMPPLCTAGYGLATGNLFYFLGAFYLYFINGVFISLATFLIVRMLKYPQKEFADVRRQKQVRAWITFFVIITILPSTYLAYLTVQRSVFERNAMAFVSQELSFPKTRVISKQFNFDAKYPMIEVSLFGEKVSDDLIELAKSKLPNYKLANADLVIFQGYDENSNEVALTSTLRSGIVEELYKQNEQVIRSKDDRIRILEREVMELKGNQFQNQEIGAEIKVLYPDLEGFTLNRTLYLKLSSMKQDTTYLALAAFKKVPPKKDLDKLEEWLRARIKSDKLMMVVQ